MARLPSANDLPSVGLLTERDVEVHRIEPFLRRVGYRRISDEHSAKYRKQSISSLWRAHQLGYSTSMKRREVGRQLRSCGWRLVRRGHKHDVWSDGESQEAVPRHAEINEKLAMAILRRARKKV